MDKENIVAIEGICASLRKRVVSNRPFTAEELIPLLLTMAESIRELAQQSDAKEIHPKTPTMERDAQPT